LELGMKITDPSLWPPEFGPLRFQRLPGEPRCSDMFLLVANGSAVAELAPLDDHDEMMLGPQYAEILSRGGCWSLDVNSEEGRVLETHVLCPASQNHGDSRLLTGELAAWGILTVLCAATWWTPKQG
jgi:hypothetical protein